MELPIAQLGQPVLRQRAAEISNDTIRSVEMKVLVARMIATLRTAKGAGLAAPQVFQGVRLFVAAVSHPFRADETSTLEVFLNPRLTPLTVDQEFAWEGCLSFAELLVWVPRFRSVRIDYLSRDHEPRSLSLEGFAARVVQHEYDHLEGILTVDRAESAKSIIKASEIEAALKQEERLRLQFGSM